MSTKSTVQKIASWSKLVGGPFLIAVGICRLVGWTDAQTDPRWSWIAIFAGAMMASEWLLALPLWRRSKVGNRLEPLLNHPHTPSAYRPGRTFYMLLSLAYVAFGIYLMFFKTDGTLSGVFGGLFAFIGVMMSVAAMRNRLHDNERRQSKSDLPS